MKKISQYQERLAYIIQHGCWKKETIQGEPQLVCLHVPAMVFDLAKEAPLITERDCSSFWRAAIGEIFAFINGARTQTELEKFGCRWWKSWVTREKCFIFGLDEGDLGPGSYGQAFAKFPAPDHPNGFNQFEAIIKQIKEKPYLATHEISPWIPPLIVGSRRQVVVAPCHGWLHFEVLGDRLHMIMTQRSADFPVGVPSNMIQYGALLLAVAKVTGYQPGTFVHQFKNAHIYQNQLPAVKEMLEREPQTLPTLTLSQTGQGITDLFAFRSEHFVLGNYQPHPALKIPVAV